MTEISKMTTIEKLEIWILPLIMINGINIDCLIQHTMSKWSFKDSQSLQTLILADRWLKTLFRWQLEQRRENFQMKITKEKLVSSKITEKFLTQTKWFKQPNYTLTTKWSLMEFQYTIKQSIWIKFSPTLNYHLTNSHLIIPMLTKSTN
jgi:hypothetical protein